MMFVMPDWGPSHQTGKAPVDSSWKWILQGVHRVRGIRSVSRRRAGREHRKRSPAGPSILALFALVALPDRVQRLVASRRCVAAVRSRDPAGRRSIR